MEKSLYQAPVGIEVALPGTSDELVAFNIEADPDTLIEATVEIEIAPDFGANLAENMSDGDLASLGSEIVALIDADIASRKEWADTFVKGLDVLGLKYEDRTEPWSGACGVYSTVLAEAAIRFQSETIMETFPAQGPVKTEIIGAIDTLKEDAARRVEEDMNYQITEVMQEYRPEHERMLYSLGLAGAAFKKVYFDPALGRQVAIFCPAEDVIIPYGASSAQTAERVTHLMRKTKNEVRKLQVSGFYLDCDLGDPVQSSTDIEKKKAEQQGFELTDDDRYQLLEIQVDYDLPGYEDADGIALPYIITVERGNGKVLAIRRNWDEKDEKRLKRQHFVQYTYIPGFGAYGMGLIHLIGGYARAGTSIIRELIDAGQLSNLPGGMKTRGLRIRGDDTPISPGEWRDVDVSGGTLRDSIMPLPYKEPSQTLLALLNQITEEARRLGAISDMNISDMSANAPVGTTLALLERTLKTMSAVQARVHYSMKQEFKLLAAIIRDNTDADYAYEPIGGQRTAKREDYDMVDVIPVSDPNSATMAQRIMQYQAAVQLAQGAPQIYDLPQLHRQMLMVLGIKNAEKLVPTDEDQKPRDPVSENMSFLKGKPTKAFMYQDHDAHIAVHQTFMQDPIIAAGVGQNPMAQQMQAAIMGHIAEHLGFQYRTKIEQRLGVTMSAPDAEMDEDTEVQLSRLVAQAAQQVLAINKGQVAQAQAQQQQQDPLIQMQQQELQLKGQEVAAKVKKIDADIMIAQERLRLDAGKQAPQTAAPEQQVAMAQQQAMQDQQEHQQKLQAAAQQQAIQQAVLQQKAQHAQQTHQQGLTHKQQAHQLKLAMAQKAAMNKRDVGAKE